MSYILDALRRADADRERAASPVPGLHSQPGASPAAAPASAPWWPWAAGAALLVGSGLAAAWWWTRTPAPVPAPATALPTPAPRPPTVPADPGPAPARPSVATPPAPTPVTVGPTPVPPAASAPVGAETTAARPSPRPPTPTPAPAPAPAPVVEASPALKREWARLGLSGSVYSESAASRFVIVHGEVVHEGATLAPDLVLEEIRPHDLILRYKGQRMRQPL